jgi:tRNA-dihydrouridine synthase
MKTTPLMVTGGIRSRAVMEEALGKGDCEMIGIGRPVCGDPDCVRKLLVDGAAALPDYENQLMLDLEEDDAARRARMRYSMQQSWYYCNEWALGDGEQERRATFDTFNSKTSSLLLI